MKSFGNVLLAYTWCLQFASGSPLSLIIGGQRWAGRLSAVAGWYFVPIRAPDEEMVEWVQRTCVSNPVFGTRGDWGY